MRELATIKKIKGIKPIENADRIEVALVGGWEVVVKKDMNYSSGDKVVYCEIDSFLPIEPEFEFLRDSCYKEMADGSKGFRLRTIRLRGQISQGLIISIKDAKNITQRRGTFDDVNWEVGENVTDALGIKKYERPIPPQLSGKMKGGFPSFIVKTDAKRLQNLTDDFSYFNDEPFWEETEKIDGTSFTAYLKDGKIGVCSRNIDLVENDENTLWKVARELELEKKLDSIYKRENFDIAIQGELIGPKIQGNKYKLKNHTLRVFNSFNIQKFKHFRPYITRYLCQSVLDVEYVPLIEQRRVLNIESMNDIKKLIQDADGKSKLNSDTLREGLVFQSQNGQKKFKAISNKFLNKYD